MAENRSYMQYAMLFGTYMGGYWILKFILFPLGLAMPLLSFLYIGLTICVPLLGYFYARMYRNMVCGGSISFINAWVFTVFMYMFAAMLTAVAHYVYFRFIDQGFVLDTCEAQIQMLAQSGTPEFENYAGMLRENLSMARAVTPIEITMQVMSWNVFCGALLAIPTALFVRRSKKSDITNPNF